MNVLWYKDCLREIIGLPTSKDYYRRIKREVEVNGKRIDILIAMNETEMNKKLDKLDKIKQSAYNNPNNVSINHIYPTMRSIESSRHTIDALRHKKDINDKASEKFIDYEMNKNLLDTSKIISEVGAYDFNRIANITSIMRKEETMACNQELLQDITGVTSSSSSIEDNAKQATNEFMDQLARPGEMALLSLPIVRMAHNDNQRPPHAPPTPSTLQ